MTALPSLAVIPEANRLAGKPVTYEIDQFVPLARMFADPHHPGGEKVVALEFAGGLHRGGQKQARAKFPTAPPATWARSISPWRCFSAPRSSRWCTCRIRAAAPRSTRCSRTRCRSLPTLESIAKGQIDAGNIRVLAQWGTERLPSFPHAPTLQEAGYPDVVYILWTGVFAPSENARARHPHPARCDPPVHAGQDGSRALRQRRKPGRLPGRAGIRAVPARPTPIACSRWCARSACRNLSHAAAGSDPRLLHLPIGHCALRAPAGPRAAGRFHSLRELSRSRRHLTSTTPSFCTAGAFRRRCRRECRNCAGCKRWGRASMRSSSTGHCGSDVLLTRTDGKLIAPRMAEYVLGAILDKSVRFDAARAQQQRRQWEFFEIGTIRNLTIGIAGLGEIGSMVAGHSAPARRARHRLAPVRSCIAPVGRRAACRPRRAAALRRRLRCGRAGIAADEGHQKPVSGADLFAHCRRGAHIINVGRGGAHRRAALLDALIAARSSAMPPWMCLRPSRLPPDHPFWEQSRTSPSPRMSAGRWCRRMSCRIFWRTTRHLRAAARCRTSSIWRGNTDALPLHLFRSCCDDRRASWSTFFARREASPVEATRAALAQIERS